MSSKDEIKRLLKNLRKQFTADTDIVSGARRNREAMEKALDRCISFQEKAITVLEANGADEDEIENLRELNSKVKENRDVLVQASEGLVDASERRREESLDILERMEDKFDNIS
jgi:hypothetical protein